MVIKFVYEPPEIDEIMCFESPYHPNLQFDRDEKVAMLAKEMLVGVWMQVDGKWVGETYGMEDSEYIEKDKNDETNVIYCYSNTILTPSLGLGTVLKSHWLGLVKALGYDVVVGDARPGASWKLNQKFGAEQVKIQKDWFETGEDYFNYRLEL